MRFLYKSRELPSLHLSLIIIPAHWDDLVLWIGNELVLCKYCLIFYHFTSHTILSYWSHSQSCLNLTVAKQNPETMPSPFLISISLFPVATVYSTLGEEAFIHGINETEVRFVITDGTLLGKIEKVIDRLPRLEHIVYFGNTVRKMDILGFPKRVQVHSMKEVQDIGSAPTNSECNEICGVFFHCCLLETIV